MLHLHGFWIKVKIKRWGKASKPIYSDLLLSLLDFIEGAILCGWFFVGLILMMATSSLVLGG
jgi:hypothetical protein